MKQHQICILNTLRGTDEGGLNHYSSSNGLIWWAWLFEETKPVLCDISPSSPVLNTGQLVAQWPSGETTTPGKQPSH